MKKTVKIDFGSDRLIAIAADLVEEHNYIGALKMLNKNAELNCNDEDCYMLYAEIFDDIGQYEKCVNSWFKYLDCTASDDLSEAYEGLAMAYMSLNNEHISAYYYNKLLMESDDLDAELRGEIMKTFLTRTPNPLKFVYPPRIADFSSVIQSGIDNMRQGRYDEAIEDFESVDEGNSSYLSARNYIAMCNIICDKNDEAEAECLSVLEKDPENVQALTILAAVRTEQKRAEESRALAKRLLEIKCKNPEDVYKIATVCCENKLHAEAYELFCKLEDELSYDVTLLFFKAVSAFNCGKTEECFAAFDKLLTLSPDAVTAKYHYAHARELAESGKSEELSYFYRLPHDEAESTLKILSAFAKLSETQAAKAFSVVDISDCILWCFDTGNGSNNEEIQLLGAQCAVIARLDGIVEDVLLNAFLPDSVKVSVLSLIGERNEDNSFGVVVCDLYKRIDFRRIEVGRNKRKNFVYAYSRLTAHFCIIDEELGEKFALAAEKLYLELEAEGRLADASDKDALMAAVFFRADVKEPNVKRKQLAVFFEADEKKIAKILGEV